ncbi:MAG TPA: hypothetical protein VGK75_12925 [Casimicrobiaceae bacterium]
MQDLQSGRQGKLRGKLNLFQTTMLCWRELHPYIAVHIVRLDQPLEPARLKRCIEVRLETAGLTGLVLDRGRGRFEFRGGAAAIEPTILAAGDHADRVKEREIERQLNLPFPADGAFVPFRFFVVDAGASFYLGLAYDHFIAGGDSIAVLLERLCDDYASDGTQAASPWTPQRYPRTFSRLFLRHLRRTAANLARLPSLALNCRRSFRAPCRAGRDPANGFLAARIESSKFGAVVRTSKAWGVTVNDLFLAALLLALAPVAAKRAEAHHRKELAVASIVNLRGEFEASAGETFGQFLTSLRVSHLVPPGIGLSQLAREIHMQTARIKEHKLYLQTLLALGWVAFAWRFLGADRRQCFLAKHYPIWAGITSLNIDSLWVGPRAGAAAAEYLRAVPTGPLAPLVVAATTLDGALQLGFSFRAADISRDTVERVTAEFIRHIENLE